MYPNRQCPWTPVALAADVENAMVVRASILQGSMAVWRSQSGRLSACADRCPHRGMRLSHGFVRGETLSCIYHGWSYDQAGQCRSIPAHPDLTPPSAIRVPVFEVEERNGVIWAADTKPAEAPPAFDGFVPLRSLTFDAPAHTVAASLGAALSDDGGLACDFSGTQSILLLAPQEENRTFAVVLVAAQASVHDRIGVSRALETLRRAAEAAPTEGQAA